MTAVQSTDVVHAAPDLLRSLAQQTRETVALPDGERRTILRRTAEAISRRLGYAPR